MATAPISLYFGVAKGRRAELETIAKASLEWASLIRDVAAVVAPDLEFEIEFVQSQEGSVWLSNLLKAAKDGDRKALASIVLAVLAFFAMGPALHLQAEFGDWLLAQIGHDHDEDIAEQVRKTADETQIEERRRKIIAIVEQDSEVESVGVDFEPRASGPITKISREHFASYAGHPPEPKPKQIDDNDVMFQRNVDVNIVRATLREGDKKPRWRFEQDGEEWSASIEDEEFIWALNRERTGLQLAVGQHMRVDIAIEMRRVDDGWEPADRRIVRVRTPKVRRSQGELRLGGE